MMFWKSGVLLLVALAENVVSDLHSPGLGSAALMHPAPVPATASPPFGAMRPDTPNPVASLPSTTEISVSRSARHLRRNRRQGLAGLEIAKDTNKHESYPTSEVMATYTRTESPLHVEKRSAREHDFMLPSASSNGSSVPKKIPSSKRHLKDGTGTGEIESVSPQPTPFHKADVTLVPVMNIKRSQGGSGFVDEETPDGVPKVTHEKNIARREVSSTPSTRKRTTEDPVHEERNQQSGGQALGVVFQPGTIA